MIAPKWDSLYKHVTCKTYDDNIGIGVRKGKK
jgi:hypothetical protein